MSARDSAAAGQAAGSRGGGVPEQADAVQCSSLGEYVDALTLSTEQLRRVSAELQEQMKAGLQGDDGLLMIPTMVDVIPDGHEHGDVFGIELGGSKLRVMFTRLTRERHATEQVQVRETPVPEEQKRCSAEELFDYVVSHLLDFAAGIGLDMREMEDVVVGLCFSFPVQHRSVKAGSLIKWTKGFQNAGAVGRDPARLLDEAFSRRGLRVTVEALVNDTVGLLCSTRYSRGPDTTAAVVVGTGTNACYVEHIHEIAKWRYSYLPRTPDMVVNVEWAAFRSPSLPLLREDLQLDSESDSPGDQSFEKLTGGLYLGDLARRILLRLAEQEGWFGSSCSSDPEAFTTLQLAQAAQDESGDLLDAAAALSRLAELPAADVPAEARRAAREVCRLVTARSARLTAAAIAGVLAHTRARNCIVIAGGGVFGNQPLFTAGVRAALGEALGEDPAVELLLAGNADAGFGAAAAAAAAFGYDRTMGRLPEAKRVRSTTPLPFPARRGSRAPPASGS